MPRFPRPLPGELPFILVALLILSPLLRRVGRHLLAYLAYVVETGAMTLR